MKWGRFESGSLNQSKDTGLSEQGPDKDSSKRMEITIETEKELLNRLNTELKKNVKDPLDPIELGRNVFSKDIEGKISSERISEIKLELEKLVRQDQELRPIFDRLGKSSEPQVKYELEKLTGLPIEKTRGKVYPMYSQGVLIICFQNEKDYWDAVDANLGGKIERDFSNQSRGQQVDMRHVGKSELAGGVIITHKKIYGLGKEDDLDALQAIHSMETEARRREALKISRKTLPVRSSQEIGEEAGQKKRGLGQRLLLRTLYGAAANLASDCEITIKGDDPQPTADQEIINKEKLFETVETKTAKYRVIGARHDVTTNPSLVEGCDAIFLEGMSNYNDLDSMKEWMNHKQYKEIFDWIKRTRKPVYFIDASTDREDAFIWNFFKYLGRQNVLNTLHSGHIGIPAAAFLAKTINEKIKEDKPTSRRDLLKFGGKVVGATAATAYGFSPIAENVTKNRMTGEDGNFDETSARRQLYKKVEGFNETVHPEYRSWVVEGRNLLMAEKAAFAASILAKKLGRKPTVGLIAGAAHFKIKDDLVKSQSERVKEIKEYFDQEKDAFPSEDRWLIFEIQPLDNGQMRVAVYEDLYLKGK